MDAERARAILTALRARSAGILDPDVLSALDVLLAQPPTEPATAPASAPAAAPAPAPAPVAVASSGGAGFVGVLRLPADVWLGEDDSWVPYEEVEPALAWSRLLSWGGPGQVKPTESGQTWLAAYVDTVMRGGWTVEPPGSLDEIVLRLNRAIHFTVPAPPDQVQPVDSEGGRVWEFKRGGSTYSFLTILAHAAAEAGYPPEREIAAGEGRPIPVPLLVYRANIGESWRADVDSIEAYIRWTEKLADQIRIISGRKSLRGREIPSWSEIPSASQESWAFWIRNHPGMLRLELALRGFFANGGTSATIALCLDQDSDPGEPDEFLASAFTQTPGRVCAPGLGSEWQAALGRWAASQGAAAVLEAPRFFASEPGSSEVTLDEARWVVSKTPYESYLSAAAAAEPASAEEGAAVEGVAPWLIVENPLTMGPFDVIRVAPPSGHVLARPSGPIAGARACAVVLPEGVGIQVEGG
ncbi:MAG: hypothetical protein ACI8S6_002545 [Myxococcota bacterium]|jgi:hypothetical protein